MATAEDVQFHYDVHNDFYALFLDSSFRAYSCGVWEQAATLEEAQQDKIRRLCDFAKIESDKTVLDIGCGWGGLMRYGSTSPILLPWLRGPQHSGTTVRYNLPLGHKG